MKRIKMEGWMLDKRSFEEERDEEGEVVPGLVLGQE